MVPDFREPNPSHQILNSHTTGRGHYTTFLALALVPNHCHPLASVKSTMWFALTDGAGNGGWVNP
jgi:hypothetical protein